MVLDVMAMEGGSILELQNSSHTMASTIYITIIMVL